MSKHFQKPNPELEKQFQLQTGEILTPDKYEEEIKELNKNEKREKDFILYDTKHKLKSLENKVDA